MTTQPPQGWFPDPQDSSRTRWWDGARWTEHTQAVTPEPLTLQVPRVSQVAQMQGFHEVSHSPSVFEPEPAAQAFVPQPPQAPAAGVFLPQDDPLPVPAAASVATFHPAEPVMTTPGPVQPAIGFGEYTPVSPPVSAQPYSFRPGATLPGLPYAVPQPAKKRGGPGRILLGAATVLAAAFVGYLAISLVLSRLGNNDPVAVVDEAALISYEVPGRWVDVTAEYRRQMAGQIPQVPGADIGVSGAWTTEGNFFSQTDAVVVMYFTFDEGGIDHGEFADAMFAGAATGGSNAQIVSQEDFHTLTGIPGRKALIKMDSPEGPLTATVSVVGQSSRFVTIVQVSLVGNEETAEIDRLVEGLTFD